MAAIDLIEFALDSWGFPLDWRFHESPIQRNLMLMLQLSMVALFHKTLLFCVTEICKWQMKRIRTTRNKMQNLMDCLYSVFFNSVASSASLVFWFHRNHMLSTLTAGSVELLAGDHSTRVCRGNDDQSINSLHPKSHPIAINSYYIYIYSNMFQ